MLIDWIHWLSSVHLEQLLLMMLPLVFVDGPRYALGSLGLCLTECAREVERRLRGIPRVEEFSHCPSVCVVLAGLNESETIGETLESAWGTYPRLEIIVVDDGSNDGMAAIARRFAETHAGVLVLRKPQRGGKSSALNFALPFTQAEIVACVDCDSHLDPSALWEIVQPFRDPAVGAVSATVLARNASRNLLTRLQALEYLRGIFIGRMFAARLGILGIISGAFGAFRRSAIDRVKGWDVGPGEDGDLTLRIRKIGYKIAFAPYARCLTNLPVSLMSLCRQRRRWEWAVVTFECRKHLDLANVCSRNFRWSNLFLLLDRWLFNVVFVVMFWLYVVWFSLFTPEHAAMIILTNYACYMLFEVIQLVVVLYYSTQRLRDLLAGVVVPLMPAYFVLLRFVSLVAVLEEFWLKRSFKDSFVPEHVRRARLQW